MCGDTQGVLRIASLIAGKGREKLEAGIILANAGIL
jgi:hypothetical protein